MKKVELSKIFSLTWTRSALFICFFIVLTACGGGGGGGSATIAPLPPTPLESAPVVEVNGAALESATNVSLNPLFSIDFQQQIDQSTVNKNTVILTRKTGSGAKAVPQDINVELSDITVGGNNSNINFTPKNPLAEKTTYVLTLTSKIKNAKGNPILSSDLNVSFTTGDSSAPTVSMINPSPTGVSRSPTIQLQFSEAVKNVTATNVILHQGSGSGPAISLGAITSSQNDAVYTFSPSVTLESETTYYLEVKTGITDLAGNALVATIFDFTTLDEKIPTVTVLNPILNKMKVELIPLVKIKFSESVQNVNTTNITINESSPTGTTTLITQIVAESSHIYTFVPATPLRQGVTYYIVFKNGITDLAGNKLDNQNSNFTTGLLRWNWLSGESVINATGYYSDSGEQVPGARSLSASWTDESGNLWLFGGSGFGTADVGSLSDLWSYNVQNKVWSWVQGSSSLNQSGNYATDGTGAPGARYSSSTWADKSGNLWLFGGLGFDKNGATDVLNDLWKYNTTTNKWTWEAGSDLVRQRGNYGNKGSYTPGNVPGARYSASSWIDESGNLWLFGGYGYTANDSGFLKDLWKYSPSNKQWIWMSGSNQVDESGNYAANGTPGARYSAVNWIDKSGNLWLFGGQGFDSAGNNGSMNDLWKYNIGAGTWTYVKGSNTVNQIANYGVMNQASSSNQPGARWGSISWVDNLGRLWLFGGYGYNVSLTQPDSLNDLWMFDPSITQWTWVGGTNQIDAAGIYSIKNQFQPSISNLPGARYNSVSFGDSSGAIFLFGGYGYDKNQAVGLLNDLWVYKTY